MAVVLDVDTMGAGVNIETLLAQEAYQGDAGGVGIPNGQAGGRTYSRYYSYASHGGFLDEFEAGASAEQEYGCFEEELLLKGVADQFVEGVVAADVLAKGDEAAFFGEEACGVEAAGLVEDILAFAEQGREGIEEGGRDRESGIWVAGGGDRGFDVGGGGVEAFDRGFAADAAAGCRVGVSLGAGEVRSTYGEGVKSYNPIRTNGGEGA